MSKETFAALAKLHAKMSDAFEALAAEEDEVATKPAAKKAKTADPDLDDDLPPAKAAGTTGKAKPKAKPKAAETITEEMVVAAATALIKAVDRAAALKIIKKHGGERVADLEEDVYADVIAAFEAAMPGEAADDDI